ncbi:radical SAM protein [Dactylosporangium sp. CA-092794]|uniref:radical SAM protein n=1 Tax=Dactylosporangium sp. CA-092794 TaxID=3239929 RepID=UPI003D8EE45B
MSDVLSIDDEREELRARFAATGRNHPYLAFTVNSICDRDCVFCKPRCVEDYGPKDQPLEVADYEAIARVAGQWGVRKAHLSGGEPTLRTDILGILAALRDGLGANANIGITTHGNLRRSLTIEAMHDAGLTYVNVSIHSLDPKHSADIMGGGDPARALNTVQAALDLGMQVKINCVLQRSYLDDAFAVLDLARALPISVRLIELQNIGPATLLFPQEFISEVEVTQRLADLYANADDVSRAALGVRSPGNYVRPAGWAGSFSFISNSSCATCSDANRIKITPTGIARPCILHNRDLELREYLDDNRLHHAFVRLFTAILERDANPAWRGYHYVDYDLRWDRIERPTGVQVLPLVPVNALGPRCSASAESTNGGGMCGHR